MSHQQPHTRANASNVAARENNPKSTLRDAELEQVSGGTGVGSEVQHWSRR